VSGSGVRSITSATIAGYHDSSEFERGARKMGHNISEVGMHW
jgi:hypothetical protein